MRYAIYYMPDPKSELWEFGSSAIGYDAFSRRASPFPDHPVYANGEALQWTSDPRRYGFHATLKAPFELRDGTTETDLIAAAQAFVLKTKAVLLDRLVIANVSAFVALVEATPNLSLAALADDCVRVFEPFRAPTSASDLARRLQKPLSARQRANLDMWGYHLVFEDFRFHMTLTGALDGKTQRELKEALEQLYVSVDLRPVAIDAIAVFRQADRDKPFEVVQRFALMLPAA